MKKIWLLLVLLCAVFASNAQNNTTQMYWVQNTIQSNNGIYGNVSQGYDREWSEDPNTHQPAARICVLLENFSKEDAFKLDFQVVSGNVQLLHKGTHFLEKSGELALYFTTGRAFQFRVSHPKYGMSSVFDVPALESKGDYSITLRNNKTFNITIETKPKGAAVFLDGDRKTESTPATLSGVTFGKHLLTVAYNGLRRTDTIDVKEGRVMFGPYDLQTIHNITIKCDQNNAAIYVDDAQISSRTSKASPPVLHLTEGQHFIRIIGENNLKSERTITVNKSTEEVFNLVATKTIEIIPVYGTEHVSADLSIDGKHVELSKNNAYALELNKKHTISASYGGNRKTKSFMLRKNSSSQYTIKIPASNTASWKNQKRYNENPFGFDIKYVTKQWVMRGGGFKTRENAPWHREDARLHGVSLGVHYNPTFTWGGGLYTGLYWEYYYSKRKDSDQWYGDDWGMQDRFNEHVIHVPLHASFRLPFSRSSALLFHGGLGFDMGIAGSYFSKHVGNFYETNTYYGHENLMPGRFNVAAEIGARFRKDNWIIGAEYSKGITEHDYSRVLGDVVARQNKMSASIGFVGDVFEDILDFYDDCEYLDDHSSIEVNYVSKQWATPSAYKPIRNNVYEFIGEKSNTKRLHGLSIGYNYHPCSPIGLGLWTGAYWEFYIASSKDDDFAYNSYMETGIYCPLHLLYRIPFSEYASVSIHGGLGFDWTWVGEYEASNSGEDALHFYGEDYGPKFVNFSGEIGASIRIGYLTLGAQYSRGITKHDMGYFYTDNEGIEHTVKTVQNKLTFSIGYTLNLDL